MVLADYDKGVITPALAHAIIDRCRQRGIPCVVDPKKYDFRVYARATVVTPNLMEAERSAGRPLTGDDAVAHAAEEMRTTLELDAMLITRGPEGMTLSTQDGITHIPAQIRDVADVTGAGDTVVAVLAACLGSGWALPEACRLANVRRRNRGQPPWDLRGPRRRVDPGLEGAFAQDPQSRVGPPPTGRRLPTRS